MTPLRIWLKDGYTVEIIHRLADDFTAATGIELDITVVDEVAAHDAFVRAPAEERPDLTTVSFWYLSEYARRGYVRPLDPTTVDVEIAAYHPAAVDAMTVDGQLWAIPHTLIAGLLSIRQDFLDEAQLPAPSSPAEAIHITSELADRTNLPALLARGAPEFPSFGTYAGWAWSEGVQLLDDDADAVAAAIGPLVDHLRRKGAEDAQQLDYVAAGDRFLAGNAVSLFDTSGWGNYIEDPARSRVAGKVTYKVLRGPHAAAQFFYSEGLAVTAWTQRAEEAAELIRWRHSRPLLEREVTEQHRFDHPRRDVREWAAVREHATTRGADGYLTALEEAWDAIDARYFPRREDFAERGRTIAAAISAAIDGQEDLVTALRAAGLR